MTFIGYNTVFLEKNTSSEKYVVIAGILNISSLMLLLLSYFFEKQTNLKTDYINELIKKNNELSSSEFTVSHPYPSLA
jgi:F0F1-type ATP synthase epsilon subunit